VSFNLIHKSQSHWSLFSGTWQKRPGKLGFEIAEMTLQIQQAVHETSNMEEMNDGVDECMATASKYKQRHID